MRRFWIQRAMLASLVAILVWLAFSQSWQRYRQNNVVRFGPTQSDQCEYGQELVRDPFKRVEFCLNVSSGEPEKHGPHLTFGPDGGLVERAHYSAGILEGSFERFDTPKMSGNYVGGKKQGRWIVDDEIAHPEELLAEGPAKTVTRRPSQGNFIDDVRSGEWITKDGDQVVIEATYQHGLPNGEWTSFSKGQRTQSVFYKNGVRFGPVTNFDKNGKKTAEEYYVNGAREGESNRFFESGKLSSSCHFLNDVKHGICVGFDENGNKTTHVNWNMGARNGSSQTFFPNGRVEYQWLHDADGVVSHEQYSSEGELLVLAIREPLERTYLMSKYYPGHILEAQCRHSAQEHTVRIAGRPAKTVSDFDGKHPIGECKVFWKNGRLHFLETYDEASGRTGDHREYNEKGDLVWAGQFLANEEVGQWQRFDQGKLIQRVEYTGSSSRDAGQ
jgi:antitoxin component YwqK of YwqJK toxin-antitoxin module